MNSKPAFAYNPATGVYAGPTEADESPLEPGVFLLPAFATFIAPPAIGEKQAAVFADGGWTVFADHIGETWFNGIEPVLIEELGEPVGLTAEQGTPTAEQLAAREAAALAALRAERDRRLAAVDWTQLADAPVDQAAWAVYRQALRDLPENTDPADPEWPVEPATSRSIAPNPSI